MKNLQHIAFALLLLLISCDKEADKPDFDRGAMLNDLNINVISLAYDDCEKQLTELDAQANNFSAAPTNENLQALKSDFVEAYLSFQHVKMLNFGTFENYEIRKAINTYPTDTAQIESNITSGSYDLAVAENVQAIGLPALDYLLYHRADNEVLLDFTIDLNASNRIDYLLDLTSKMKSEMTMVADNWQTEANDFVAATSNDATSSTNILFNAFVQDIELVKNAKIGIPAGNQTGGSTLPHYVEGYYSDLSIDLAIENLTALKNCFNGPNSTISFDDYIRDVESEDVTNSLADQISAKFDACISAVAAIGNPLAEKVDTDNTTVQAAFTELKSLVTYTKTDMSSALGLLITFSDNDGD